MKISKKNIVILVSVLVVLFVYVSIVANSFINKDNKIGFFSYNFYIMTHNSSESGTNKGDLVIAKKVENKDIKSGDNIVYKQEDDINIKQVKSINNDSSTANIVVENAENSSDNIVVLGKMTGKVPGVGNLAMLIQTPLGTMVLLSIIVCIFLIVKKLNNRDNVSNSEEGGTNLENDEQGK